MIPWPWCRRESEPVSDIDIAVADSLKVLDLKRPIREADIAKGPSGAGSIEVLAAVGTKFLRAADTLSAVRHGGPPLLEQKLSVTFFFA